MISRLRTYRSKGTSLIEVLVVTVLLTLVTGLMVSVYLLGNRYLNRTQLLSRLQQQASQAIYKVAYELSATTDANSSLNSVTGANPHVWFLSSQSDDGKFHYSQTNGAQLWQRWVCFYLDTASSDLYRVSVPLTSSNNSPPFTAIAPPASLAMFQSASVTQRTLAGQSVSDFRVTPVGASLYEVTVSCKMTDRENKEWIHTLATQVYLQQTD